MPEQKPYVAVSMVTSEYASYYGVLTIRRGRFQEWQAMAALVDVAKKRWPEVSGMKMYDCNVTWFESVPWKEGCEPEDFERCLGDGGWHEVDPDLLDEENGATIRTSVDKAVVDDKDIHFTFFEKHGDHEFSSDWLALDDIAKHFGEV